MSRAQVVVASKIDVAVEGHRLRALRSFAVASGMKLYEVSSVTGQGVEDLKWAAWRILETVPKTSVVDLSQARH